MHITVRTLFIAAVIALPGAGLLGCGGGSSAHGASTSSSSSTSTSTASSSAGSASSSSGSGGASASSSSGASSTSTSSSSSTSSGAPGASDLHVVGHTLVDQGKVVRLLGVDHAGTEYSCVGGGSDGSQGYAVFEGPSDASLIQPMLAWKINAIRLPLNEACWLGIGVVKPQYAGQNYRSAIQSFVSMVRGMGLYVILDLHWAAPGTMVGTSQQPMADADNSPMFWSSVATMFKGDLGVVFDLFNEPYLDAGNINGNTDPWQCLESGCSVKLQSPLSGTYQSAGHQALVTAVRQAGAKNVIMVSGLGYTSDLSGWAAHKPTDATGNLTASLHLYNFNGCTDMTCWNMRYQALAGTVPIITGENGENDCAHGFVDAYMTWADGLGISYLGWSWNQQNCSNFPALISDYNGTPTGFGQGLKAHLLSL